jgi:hypothetical protein
LLLNGSQFSQNPDIELLKKGEGTFELMAQPGEYEFEASLAY